MSGAPRIHLIDAHVYIFRSYFSLPEMLAPDGTHTAAAYGFTNTLIKFLADEQPTHLALAFDYALTSFRNDLEPGYKADRSDAPPDLEPQFDMCIEAGQALGLATYEVEHYEADDVIATLCDQLLAQGASVMVVSADKDLTQLVTPDGRVLFHDLARRMTLEAVGVRNKFGVEPAQIPDYLGLVGDTVDNLPGVPGIGPKSAAALLGAFGSLEAIPSDADQWKDVNVRGSARMAERFAAHRERALKTKELATVRRDVPGIRVSPDDLAVRSPDHARMDALCDRLGWEGIRQRVPGR